VTALAAAAIVVGGCAAANNATSNQGEPAHQAGYGLSSSGTTTSLYEEIFGSRQPAAAPAAATATAAAVPPPPAQAPAAAQAPPEPNPPVAYGITAKGPTTDLYTELFGPKRSGGQ